KVAMITVPDGADVIRDGQTLGQTPLVLTLAESAKPIVITLRKKGYRDLVERIVPLTDQKLRLSLEVADP
ncbi:MAG: PEGA domain-containing protein, partial [Myxococcota bacterium]